MLLKSLHGIRLIGDLYCDYYKRAFCRLFYVLKSTLPLRILYIDVDLHHGNGVEAAFYQTSAVLTYSVHKYESGFYPGTGGLESVGEGKGLGYSVNIPLKSGASDRTLAQVCEV